MFRILLYARRTTPTVGSRIREAISSGRILFRALIDQNFPLKGQKRSQLVDLACCPAYSGKRNCITTRLSSFTTSLLHRIRTRWIFNTFAANLRRNRAKELMYYGGRFPLITFIGLSLAKGPTLLTETQELEGIPWEIRKLFSTIEPLTELHDTNSPQSPELKNYQLGELLAKGCNAVVYSAREKSKSRPTEELSVSNKAVSSTNLLPVGSLAPYDTAVKIMFNYEAESNAIAIWRAMNREILPARSGMFGQNVLSLTDGRKSYQHLPPHPNIVDMHFAFADRMPLLPEALSLYPEALPTKLNEYGCGHNMTLFIVMKRYHCTLLEFLQNHTPSFYTSLLLFTQLLEGIVHLTQNQIAHRDLKLDNILIDLRNGLSNPQLVITDFGYSLPSAYGLRLPFSSEELCRGGNISLMAPEVLNSQPGIFSVIDYSRADLWAAGAIAYDIFGSKNPFYSNNSVNLRSDSYNEQDLPSLPDNVPVVIMKLVKGMLRKNFCCRPSPSFSATVCQLLLHLPCHWLKACPSDHKKILEWLVNTAGITMWQAKKGSNESPIEELLRVTFFSRVRLDEVLDALNYITAE